MDAMIDNRVEMAEEGFAPINGLQLYYRKTGDPDAPPVVILHGLMGVCREWDVLTEHLAERLLVITPDQRGHGASDWAPEYTLDTFANDLVALLQHFGLSRLPVIGHSLGGMVAMRVAATHPELITRLAIIDVGPDSLVTEFGTEQLPQLLTGFAAASYEHEDEALKQWLAGDPLARASLLRHYVRHNLRLRPDGRLGWKFDAAGFIALVTGGIPVEQLRASLDRIGAPTLLVRGRHSSVLSPASAAAMVRKLPDAHLVEIPGGGHDLGVQQPEAVAAAVRRFLTEA